MIKIEPVINLLTYKKVYINIYKSNFVLDEEEDCEEGSSQIRTEETNFEFLDFVKKLDIFLFCFKLMFFKFLNSTFSFIIITVTFKICKTKNFTKLLSTLERV